MALFEPRAETSSVARNPRSRLARERLKPLYEEARQRHADRKAAEADPQKVNTALDMLRGVPHGLAAAADETIEFLGDIGILKSTETGGDLGEFRGFRNTLARDIPEPTTGWGKGTAGVAQFVGAWAGPGKLAQAVELAGKAALKAGAKEGAEQAATKGGEVAADVGRMMGRGAVADAVGFDPHEERLSTMLAEVPVLEQVIPDFMESTDPSESHWKGRMANALEGGVIGGGLEAVLRSPQMYKAAKRAWASRRAGRPEKAQATPESAALQDRAKAQAVEAVVEGEEAVKVSEIAELAEQDAFAREAEPLTSQEWQALPPEARELARRGESNVTIRRVARGDRPAGDIDTALAQRQAGREAPAQEVAGEDIEALLGRVTEQEKAARTPKEKAPKEQETPAPVKIDLPVKEMEALPKAVRAHVESAASLGWRIPLKAAQSLARREAAGEMREWSEGGIKQKALTPEEITELEPDAQELALYQLSQGRFPEKGVGTQPKAIDPEDFDELDEVSLELDEFGDPIDAGPQLDEFGDPVDETLSDMELMARAEAAARTPEQIAEMEAAIARREAARKLSHRHDMEGHTVAEEVENLGNALDADVGAFAPVYRDRYGEELPMTEATRMDEEVDWLFGLAVRAEVGEGKAVQRAYRASLRRIEEVGATTLPGRVKAAQKAVKSLRRAVYETTRGREVPAGELRGTDVVGREHRQAYLEDVPLRDAWREGMERGRFVAERRQTVEEAWNELPEDFGSALNGLEVEKADRALAKRRPELQEGLEVAEAYRKGSSWSSSRMNRPAMFYMEDIGSIDDFAQATTAVGDLLKGQRRTGTSADAVEAFKNLIDENTRWRDEVSVALRPAIGTDIADAGAVMDTIGAMAESVSTMSRLASRPDAEPAVRAGLVRDVKKMNAYLRWAQGDIAEAQRLMDEIPRLSDDADATAKRMSEHETLSEMGTVRASAMAQALDGATELGKVVRLVSAMNRKPQRGIHRALEAGGRFVSRPMREIWINSVLSSPATHMRNIVGNGMMPLLRIPEQFIAATSEGGLAQGRAELQGMVQGLLGGFRDGLFLARNDWQTSMAEMSKRHEVAGKAERLREIRKERAGAGFDALRAEFIRNAKVDDMSRANMATGIPDAMLRPWDEAGGWSKLAHDFDSGIRKAINAPGAALQAEDVFFKTLTYRMEVQRQAAREAFRKGYKDAKAVELIRERLAKPPEHIHATAMQAAHLDTFTNDLGRVGQMTLDNLNKIPGARYVVPFFRTPANIVTMAGRYVPYLEKAPALGRLYRAEQEALARGGRDAMQVKARRWVGLGLLMTAGALAANGRIRGAEVVNPQFRSTARRMGMQEYSVKIGDTWVDYKRWAGPLGLVLAAAADATTLLEAAATEEEMDIAASFAHIAGSLVGGVVDEMWMGSIAEFYEVVAGEYKQQAAERFLSSVARSALPLGALRDDAREMLQLVAGEGQRENLKEMGGYGGSDEDLLEAVGEMLRTAARSAISDFARIGEDGRRFPVLDLYGEPATRFKDAETEGRFGLAFASALSPAVFLTEKTDPLSKAILDTRISIPIAKKTLLVDGPFGTSRTLELSREQYQYFAERQGKYFKRFGTAKVTQARYRDAPSNDIRRSIIATERERATSRARQELLRKFPELRLRRNEERMRLRREVRGG